MAISEKKMRIVIDNYFKSECDVNTSIRQAFEKGFMIGVKKGQSAQIKTGEWIPCSERLPKKNEYVGNVCKYYLIQDEYGDMHVAHLSSRGWETIESIKALGCDVVAWMPLPKPYREDGGAE